MTRFVKDMVPHPAPEVDRGPFLDLLRGYGHDPDSVVGIRFDATDELEIDVVQEAEPGGGFVIVTFVHPLSDPWEGRA